MLQLKKTSKIGYDFAFDPIPFYVQLKNHKPRWEKIPGHWTRPLFIFSKQKGVVNRIFKLKSLIPNKHLVLGYKIFKHKQAIL